MFKIDFENLNEKPCSYKQLLTIFKDEAKLATDIESIRNHYIRTEYILEAQNYYAEKYDCDAKDVFFGDINFRRGYWNGLIIFPYVVVVGSLRAKNCEISAPSLQAVLGELDLTGATANISSLEYARKLVVTGANIKYFNKDMKVGELVCNKNCFCKGLEGCFKSQVEEKKIYSIEK